MRWIVKWIESFGERRINICTCDVAFAICMLCISNTRTHTLELVKPHQCPDSVFFVADHVWSNLIQIWPKPFGINSIYFNLWQFIRLAIACMLSNVDTIWTELRFSFLIDLIGGSSLHAINYSIVGKVSKLNDQYFLFPIRMTMRNTKMPSTHAESEKKNSYSSIEFIHIHNRGSQWSWRCIFVSFKILQNFIDDSSSIRRH